ncbi:diguanylate cyclase domain protein [Burkholderia oklahomensis]|uniref:diguanylate cyclase n=1 Tax=Burkholderia oklahomensis TaxID=342113 RepID=A0AAI8FMI2_9BURK|nr:sensor domain-containing diguanylate cyclase [Burkholderia oklahomensis]AIO66571.1 diguanylate cyclase domain protein [Burkholderia oklahomensis]AOI42907.1 diguanylate cyclase [Burkholderia oklahomensis EO147]KUY58552.1 diguanylate cyclase [Burkholderia oklahomensis EO147]
MSTVFTAHESPRVIGTIARIYTACMLIGFALAPAILIAYLWYFIDPHLTFENHQFHELAIAAATLEGLFVTYVTWRCYLSSGEPLLRWLTLGFFGFALIYSLHGAFTGMAHRNIWLFLLYGPASRLVMSLLLLIGQLTYFKDAEPRERRTQRSTWLPWIAGYVVVCLIVAAIAYSPIAGNLWTRVSMEGGAMIVSLANVALLLVRRIRTPLMLVYGISVMWFALSSVAFILGKPWNHMWWLAHAIFASGFFLLSFGVVQALMTSRSFSTVYSQQDLMARLAESMARTEGALQELKRTNQKLEHLATTDPLTGASNRRKFIEQMQAEIARAKRDGTAFSLLALDLDNFKTINDNYGHQVGDVVLRNFVRQCLTAIRPYDHIARVGGEEFMVLLPRMLADAASGIAERVRTSIANASFGIDGKHTPVTVSIGVSQYGRDGDTVDEILSVADKLLYRAKHEGRNRVVAS